MRLDKALVEAGLVPSRARAAEAIAAGQVFVDGRQMTKASATVLPDANLELRGETLRYVSRGGLKLEAALAAFPIDLAGATVLDVGSSTGGFTDCCLQNGAKLVYAVDVGTAQLVPQLLDDPRVVSLENTNARYLTRQLIPEPIDFACSDVSFISLDLILPSVRPLMAADGQMVCLVKPQFEVGREKLGKRGVVKDPHAHVEVLRGFITYAQASGFAVAGIVPSPIKGPEGNREYLAWLKAGECELVDIDIKAQVTKAFELK